MITAEEIESFVASGEGYNAEFKERVPKKLQELSREICAFANVAGGVLLIGVSDDNVIRGVSISNEKRSAIVNAIGEINPPVPCEMYAVEVKEKEVWVLEVFSGPQKPYTLSGAIYTRQGPNTQKITPAEQMRALFQQADKIYFDESACPEFEVDKDLDEEYFEEFRAMARLSPSIRREQILSNLKLYLPDGKFKKGGVLFFWEETGGVYGKGGDPLFGF